MSVNALEYRTDIAGGKSYASRNMAHIRQAYEAPSCNTSSLEWLSTLRQVRPGNSAKPLKRTSVSMPDLHVAAREGGPARSASALAGQHQEGVYLTSSATVSKYQNYAQTKHLVGKYSPDELDWIMQLRSGMHAEDPSAKWRRFHTRPQQSFDMMAENCSKTNEEYQRSHITPQDRRIDRRTGAISISNIREDPMNFHRWEGCEGSNMNLWRHLTDDHRRGYKLRRAIQAETTMRGGRGIDDVRTDGCLVEMLGKKKWNGAQHYNPSHARPPNGDPKLHYLGQMRPVLERNEENRRVRMSKHPRTDMTSVPQVRGGRSDSTQLPA